jgi:hypothetical protein
MRFGVNRIRPSGSQGLLNPVLAATGSTDQLNSVQDGGWGQLLSQGKLQFCEIGKNFAQKIRVP